MPPDPFAEYRAHQATKTARPRIDKRKLPENVNSWDDLSDDGLSYRQLAFVEYYLGEARLNATEAAAMAGYSGERHTLKTTGCRLLLNANVASRVRARLAQLGITREAVLGRIVMMAGFLPADCFDAVENAKTGEPAIEFSLERAAETGAIACIRKLRPTDLGYQVEFTDPRHYLEILAKHTGLIGDGAHIHATLEHTRGRDVNSMSEEELRAELEGAGVPIGDQLAPRPNKSTTPPPPPAAPKAR